MLEHNNINKTPTTFDIIIPNFGELQMNIENKTKIMTDRQDHTVGLETDV